MDKGLVSAAVYIGWPSSVLLLAAFGMHDMNAALKSSSKFALRSMTQCWQAELRPYNVRVVQINPSEVPTAFGREDRTEKDLEPQKLSPQEIADVLIASLKMDQRGFIPEVTIHATNPF